MMSTSELGHFVILGALGLQQATDYRACDYQAGMINRMTVLLRARLHALSPPANDGYNEHRGYTTPIHSVLSIIWTFQTA